MRFMITKIVSTDHGDGRGDCIAHESYTTEDPEKAMRFMAKECASSTSGCQQVSFEVMEVDE